MEANRFGPPKDSSRRPMKPAQMSVKPYAGFSSWLSIPSYSPGHSISNDARLQRLAWVDICRGIGIIIVVVSHVFLLSTNPYKQFVAWGIFLFHIPLFFILSGYFYSPSKTADLARKRSETLLRPYAAFLITLVAIDVAITYARGQTLAPWQFREIATHSALGGQFLTGKYGIFWFVTCLFLSQLAYNFVAARCRSAMSPGVLMFVAGSCTVGYAAMYLFPGAKTPWAISCVPIAIVALWFGHLLGQTPSLNRLSVVALICGVFLLCGVAAAAGVRFSFTMKDMNFGPPLLGIVLAMALSLALILIAMRLQNWQAVQWLIPVGRASLVIMFVHQFVHFTLREMGVWRDSELVLASLIVPFALFFVLDRFRTLRWAFLGKAHLPVGEGNLPTAA